MAVKIILALGSLLYRGFAQDISQIACSEFTCTAACDCALGSCVAEIGACAGSPECMAAHDCVKQCPCGDDSCVTACAGEIPEAKAVAECIVGKCHEDSVLRSTGIGCGGAACKAGCECATKKCLGQATACILNPKCQKTQACANECGCGDDDCIRKCADDNGTPQAHAVADCIVGKCHADSILRSESTGIGCGHAACKEGCECATKKCMGVATKCLLNPKCAKTQSCANKCACGDDDCIRNCADENGTPQAHAVADCIIGKCHTDSMLRSSSAGIGCGHAACKEGCECATKKCMGVATKCLLNPKCAKTQSCANKCACGDDDCIRKCADENGTSQAKDVADCIIGKCHTPALRSMSAGIGCGDSACKEGCECAVKKCLGVATKCLLNPKCQTTQACANKCACGDDACIQSCAAENGTPQAQEVADCIVGKCHMPPALRAASSGIGCGGSACKKGCECATKKCMGAATACLLNPKCQKTQTCANKCKCGDDACVLKCASDNGTPQADKVARCIVDKCHIDA